MDGRVYQSGSLKRRTYLCWQGVGARESTQTVTAILYRYCIPTGEYHPQNPDLPEAGGPLGHGRQLPAGAAHAAATAMATLGEQGANWKAVDFVGKPWSFVMFSCFVRAPGDVGPFQVSLPLLGVHLDYSAEQLWWPVNVAIFQSFSQMPSVWWVWSEDYLRFCRHFGRSESTSNWSVALIFTSVSSSQRAKSLSHIDVHDVMSFRMMLSVDHSFCTSLQSN